VFDPANIAERDCVHGDHAFRVMVARPFQVAELPFDNPVIAQQVAYLHVSGGIALLQDKINLALAHTSGMDAIALAAVM